MVKVKSKLKDMSRNDLLKAVHDLCSDVTRVTDPQILLETSLVKIVALFSAQRGSIFMLKDNGEDLLLETSTGMRKQDELRMTRKMDRGIVGRVAQLKKPLFVEDMSKDKRFENFKGRSGYATQAFICAPLMIKDQLLGVINIADKSTGQTFSEDDLTLLDFLTTQVALNYRRVQLLHKFKLIVKEKENLKSQLGKTKKEKKTLKRQVDLQEKLATIGKLAGGIAHKFNNPLDGVIRYTHLCLDQTKEDDLVHGYLLEIQQGLNRMANIVKNLLACSRNEPPTNATIDMIQAVDHALWEKEASLEYKEIQVVKEFDEGLPRVKDYGLERVMTNLISNAIDAMDAGGVLTVSVRVNTSLIVLMVEDTGCGISSETLQQIFEPFYTTKEIEKGCGLGLTIVGEIIKMYDGDINILSEEGKGTCFAIQLPLEEV